MGGVLAGKMKLTDFIPGKETLEGFQGIEKQLQSRRYTGKWSLLVAVAAGVVQIVLAYPLKWQTLSFPASFTWKDVRPFLTSESVILPCLAIVAACIWVAARYTSILFKQSNEPFRYTFSISKFGSVSEFSGVASAQGERFPVEQIDQLELLRYDLTERLNRRVRRFSLLEPGDKGETAQSAKGTQATPHFQIDGDYAVREEENGTLILHVWPRVRIGLEGNPFTLAHPVRLPIDDPNNSRWKTKPATLDLEEYERLVERVYSSVATEIYKQIEIDLRDKMTWFPTLSLQAVARYIEAEDFETSNTIDAYDRALEMYRSSLDELRASWWHVLMRKAGGRIPLLVSWDWTGIRARMEAEAKTKLGYSRCLLYRRLVSEMAGRKRNPIFETRPKLLDATKLLQRCYNSLLANRAQRLPATTEEFQTSEIALARDAVCRPLWRKLVYQQVREDLCETFAVAALAYSLLADSRNAERFRQLADALAANSTPGRVRLFLLLAQAELVPELPQKLAYLNQARELNPDSEIALYRFAYYSDLLARDNEGLTQERVNYLVEKYEAVLKVNPANIASLIGQGYLFWLKDNLDQAAKKLRAGIELQAIVNQTFVGDLKYCLARVEVERAACQDVQSPEAIRQLNQAVLDYEEATGADPAVAAIYLEQHGYSRNTYYEFINATMLEAYKRFATRARGIAANGQVDAAVGKTLLAYALNDYGNACFNCSLRFEPSTGKYAIGQKALLLLKESTEGDPANVMALYNYFWALSRANDGSSDELLLKLTSTLLTKSAQLPPAALAAVLSKAQEKSGGPASDTPESNVDQDKQKDGYVNQNKADKQPPSQPAKEQPAQQKTEKAQLTEELKPVLNFVKEKSSLALFSEYLSPSDIGKLLEKIVALIEKDSLWPEFGDMEVFVLVVLARIWARGPEERHGSIEIFEHIRSFYYPEDFETALYLVDTETGTRQDLNSVIDGDIERSRRYDSTSCFYKSWSLSRVEGSVRGRYKDWAQFSKETDYPKVIELYKKAQEQCGDLPAFHDLLAVAYECRATQLAADNFGGDGATKGHKEFLESVKRFMEERRRACRLDPMNQQYRDSLLTPLGRQLMGGSILEDPLEQRVEPKLIEVEFSDKSIPDLGISRDTGLPAELVRTISDVRSSLTRDAGFVLPGINFRDNSALERGRYRFLIRGVPLRFESLHYEAAQDKQWEELTRCIKEAALRNAASFYASRDCYVRLRELAKADGLDYSDIQSDSEPLLALTWVLKALLGERTPIAEFAAIVAEFRRCRSRKLDFVSTVEEIRSLPEIRKQLPGNSLQEPAAIRSLNRDLEDRIYRTIDWNRSEPMVVSGSPEIRQEVRLLALNAKTEAGKRGAVLLTSSAVRPFARKMVVDIDVNVLSRREIFPELLSRI